MNLIEPAADPLDAPISPPIPQTKRRSASKIVTQWIRRGHLYLGLFLFPWAVLYGITAFLFNHPTAFSDQPTVSYSRSLLVGTSLETPPNLDQVAEEVVAKLNALQQPSVPYRLAGHAHFTGREFAFATVKVEGQSLSVLVDLKNGGGTVRTTVVREQSPIEQAPFSTSKISAKLPKVSVAETGAVGKSSSGNAVLLTHPIQDQVRATIPTILERTGFPNGEITVTSVPDVSFPVQAEGRIWTAVYSPITGSVRGRPSDAQPETELSLRRFLLRLHMAHGYPGEMNSKWFWAIIVDLMAFTMCFWGLSGLIMWWQIKATRIIGFVVLCLSTIAATALGFGMHSLLSS